MTSGDTLQQAGFWIVMQAAGRFDSCVVRAQILRMHLLSMTLARRTAVLTSFHSAMSDLDTEAAARAGGFVPGSEQFRLARIYAVTSGRSAWEDALRHPERLAEYQFDGAESLLGPGRGRG